MIVIFILLNFFQFTTVSEAKFTIEYWNFTSQGLPYDYFTMMHFKACSYSKKGLPTIIPLNPYVNKVDLGKNVHPGKLDYLHLNFLYCDGSLGEKLFVTSTYTYSCVYVRIRVDSL